MLLGAHRRGREYVARRSLWLAYCQCVDLVVACVVEVALALLDALLSCDDESGKLPGARIESISYVLQKTSWHLARRASTALRLKGGKEVSYVEPTTLGLLREKGGAVCDTEGSVHAKTEVE